MRALGLDIGGSNVKFAHVDGSQVVETYQVPSGGDIGAALGQLRDRAAGFDAIGIGLAGLVLWPEGRFVWGPHLSGDTAPLREPLAAELGVPVAVDNDANMAAVAELRNGGARGVDSALILTIGTGIGAAIVAGGELYRGRSFAGEIGHVRATEGGSACKCGRSGCWETLVSGRLLDEAARRLASADPGGGVDSAAAGSPARALHLVAAADSGDGAARDALSALGTQLGRLIADQVAALDPQIVVVGGAVSGAGPWFFEAVDRSVSTNLQAAAYREPVDIRLSPFGTYSGAVGAALAALEAADD